MELREWRMWWRRAGFAGARRVLMEEWDPIGVRGEPAAADEYDNYVPKVGGLLRAGAPPAELAAYLTTVRTEWMELPPAPDLDAAAAEALVRWYAEATPGA